MTYSNRPKSMTNHGNTQETYSNDAIASLIDRSLAENRGNAQSMRFEISARTGSFASELHTLRQQLQYYHEHHITAYALMPVVKSGNGPDAMVQMSGLMLLVYIGDMSPDVLMCVRATCQLGMRQLARDKGLHNSHRDWQELLADTAGKLVQGDVASEVKTFTRDFREAYLTGAYLTNGAIHYRIGSSGDLESAVVDYAEEPTPLKWTPA